MAKYRILDTEELKSLEKEFIDFLILNGITGEDWKKLSTKEPKAYLSIIDSFSDVIFERILRNIKFLEFRDENEIYCIQCLEEKMILIGIKANGLVNFTVSSIDAIINSKLKIYTTEKNYSRDKQLELFQMLQNGYQISDGSLFKKLSLAMVSDV